MIQKNMVMESNDIKSNTEIDMEILDTKICSKRKRILDSDDEFPVENNGELSKLYENSELYSSDNESKTVSSVPKKRIIKNLSSDSESDGNISDIDKKSSSPAIKKVLDPDIYDAEGSDEELHISAEDHELSRNSNKEKKKKKLKKTLDSDIYDAEESSDEERPVVHEPEEEIDIGASQKKKKHKAKRTNYQRKSKQTAIEEIQSETQRLVRQSRISLPYHHPKERSLSDFLNRKKSLPGVSLKTSSIELSKAWETIEEREKTAESFYKSESETSDVSEEDRVPTTDVPDDANKLTVESLSVNNNKTETQEIQNKTGINAETLKKKLEFSISVNETEAEENKFIEKLQNDNLCYNVINSERECANTTDKCLDDLKIIDECSNFSLSLNEKNIFDQINNSEMTNFESTFNKSVDVKINDDIETKSENILNDSESNGNKILNKKRLKLNNLLEAKLSLFPKLNGQPDQVINFMSPEKPGAVKLISRFMKHVTFKPKIKDQENVVVAISEVNENGEIIALKEETIEIKRNDEAFKLKIGDNSKPGENRMKLKATLKHKIAESREQQFAKRIEENKINEEEIFDEGKIIDDDDEIEEVLSDDESDTDSDVENDVIIKDNVEEKNPFVDEEAEESEKDDELDGGEDSDVDEYSDVPSVDIDSLLDKNNDNPGIGSQNDANDLMSLCSGAFMTQAINMTELEKNDVSFTENEKNDSSSSPSSFDLNNKSIDFPENLEDSDEEIIIKKKKKAKLSFSDDEDENKNDVLINDEDKNENDGLINDEDETDDENGDEEERQESENEAPFINDDEIVYSGEDEEDPVGVDEKYISKKTAKRFLEAEAELSGSDWGSADEDELDLDTMEKEEGDDDVINQRKVRSELEKIHMKEILDEDKREIRVLQELFLEDGELHSDGPKRQRQFRWYNQDGDNENGSSVQNLEGEAPKDDGEEEEDESWRKTRIEREIFLLNHKVEEVETNDENVRVKLGKQTVLKPAVKPSLNNSPDPRKRFSLPGARGSFLSRGEKLLNKLAEVTNVTSDNPLGKLRGQRNMVFAVVSPPKEVPIENQAGKRKNTNNLHRNAAKRIKFSEPTNKKPSSLIEKLKMFD